MQALRFVTMTCLTLIAEVAATQPASIKVPLIAAPIDVPLAVRPDEMEYAQLPGGPPGVLSAVVVGDPGKKGVYVLRNRFPPNFVMPIHLHSEWRVMTVLEGTLFFGYGDKPDEHNLKAFGPGSVIVEPKDIWHYFRSGDDGAVLQFVAEGPLDAGFPQ